MNKESIDNLNPSEREQFNSAYEVATAANQARNLSIEFGTRLARHISISLESATQQVDSAKNMKEWQHLGQELVYYTEVTDILMPPRIAFEPKADPQDAETTRELMTPEQRIKANNIRQAMFKKYGRETDSHNMFRDFPIVMHESETGEKIFTVISAKGEKLVNKFSEYNSRSLVSMNTQTIDDDDRLVEKYQYASEEYRIVIDGKTYNATTGMTRENYIELVKRTEGRGYKVNHFVLLLGEPAADNGLKPLGYVDFEDQPAVIESYQILRSLHGEDSAKVVPISSIYVHPAIVVE